MMANLYLKCAMFKQMFSTSCIVLDWLLHFLELPYFILFLPSTSMQSFYSEALASISHLQYIRFAHTHTLANAVTYVSFITVHRLP